jgi:excisionase family DNA binding protein
MKSVDSRLNERTEPLWTVEEVANYLRVKEETVRMMARTKRLPAMKVGKAWRFRSSEIKDMLFNKGLPHKAPSDH